MGSGARRDGVGYNEQAAKEGPGSRLGRPRCIEHFGAEVAHEQQRGYVADDRAPEVRPSVVGSATRAKMPKWYAPASRKTTSAMRPNRAFRNGLCRVPHSLILLIGIAKPAGQRGPALVAYFR